MKSVLLDKNAGDRRWRNACRQENLVDCDLLPRRLRDAPDTQVLEFAIENNRLVVTFDRLIAEQCCTVLAGSNPGILIIRMDDDSLQRISTRTAPKIVAEFKAAVPDWHELIWRNVVLELTPTLIYVYHTWSDRLVRTAILRRSELDWPQKLRQQLEAISMGPSADE